MLHKFKILFSITFVFLTIQVSLALAINLQDGLVAYYPLNGDAKDHSGNNNDANIVGSITFNNGVFHNAAIFDGTSHLLIDNFYFPISTGSISMWVNVSPQADGIGYAIDSETNFRSVFSYDTINDTFRAGHPEIPLIKNCWVLYTYIYENGYSSSGTRKVYENGELKMSDNGYSNNFEIPSEITGMNGSTIGCGIHHYSDKPTANDYFYKGMIDDVRIYNRALSEAEVKSLYEEANPEVLICSFDNNRLEGKIVTDSSVLGYTASVGGATIKATPYNITSITDIYGNFILSNLPTGDCIIEIESSYFQFITKTITVLKGENVLKPIPIHKPKCANMYTQEDLNQLLDQLRSEKDDIITEQNKTITQLNSSIASMYTQGYLDIAIKEAEKRGELKYDINNDGKVGLEEIIRYLEQLSGVRLESIIIFPDDKKYYLSD